MGMHFMRNQRLTIIDKAWVLTPACRVPDACRRVSAGPQIGSGSGLRVELVQLRCDKGAH